MVGTVGAAADTSKSVERHGGCGSDEEVPLHVDVEPWRTKTSSVPRRLVEQAGGAFSDPDGFALASCSSVSPEGVSRRTSSAGHRRGRHVFDVYSLHMETISAANRRCSGTFGLGLGAALVYGV